MNISNKKELDAAIIELEKRKVIQQSLLVSQFHETYDSMRPSNLIKGLFSKVSHTPGVKGGLIKTITGFGITMLTKKLFLGNSPSLIKKLLSTAVELGIAKTALSNTSKLQAYGTAIFQNLFKKKSRPKQIVL